MTSKIRVLVVDDSALVREMLTTMLNSDPDIEVVGAAPDPFVAREKIKQLNPDVLTLDVEMPHMDGITFLEKLMRLRPMPVVMVSTLTEHGAEVTLRALELGAVDFVTKPKIDLSHTFEDYAEEIAAKVKAAARAKVDRLARVGLEAMVVQPRFTADAVIAKAVGLSRVQTTDMIVAIGASTGGTEAIKEVLIEMPADAPGVVIAQHIPEAFSGPFARRMDQYSEMSVCEAADGQQILAGHVYIAPGHSHLLVERSGARYVCRLSDGPPVNRHRPSVDVLFRSVCQAAGMNAVGVILTGMGNDGAAGLKEMLDAGAHTLAQDERSSVVWGMPGEAVKLNAASEVVSLEKMAGRIMDEVKRRRHK
jgi:two-component system chemotaxis response regulator CheB